MPGDFKLEDFLPYRLNRLAAEVSERLSAIYARRFGLDIPQWRVLANLAHLGEATAQRISAAAGIHKSTVSRAVRSLESRKLVARAVADGDHRAYALRLTPAGRRLFASLKPLVLAFEKDLLARLEPDGRKALLKGVAALERALAETDWRPGRDSNP